MKSLIIGIARTGSPNNFVLNPDTRYISMCGSKPEVSFSIDCGQYDFIRMVNGLRYTDADPEASSGAISFFNHLTSKFFEDLKFLKVDENDFSPLHIRLVITPFELAQIPFEFILSPSNIAGDQKIPLLANPERKFTMTREVRQESEARYIWPHKPRILFAWAQPDPEMTVPYQEHLAVLESIVIPLAKPKKDIPGPVPNIGEFLTELPDASLESIRKKLQEAIAEQAPYTHVHILAHGGQKLVYGVTEFRLIICKEGTKDVVQKIDGNSLAEALLPTDHDLMPTVVSLSVCDSGNVGNTILPSGSLAYQLHNSGIPCVFASQFPLTQQGSVKLVKTLFYRLIHGGDPRMALYETRLDLIKEQNHDWASLVAYARFPEDINEQLQAVNLRMLFGSMKVTNAWVDHVFKFWKEIEDGQKEKVLQDLETRLNTSIKELYNFLDPGNSKESKLANELLQSEHFGLLGSAYKRKAEYHYRLIEFDPEKKTDLIARSIKSLESAKEFYGYGLEANPASHWTTMQYLSLKAVLEGTLTDVIDIWYVTKRMAERAEKTAKNEEDQIWALGTLAELYMLKPLTHSADTIKEEIETSTQVSMDYLNKMAGADKKYNDAKESTARQFERYIHWWPILLAEKYPPWLKDSAFQLRNVME